MNLRMIAIFITCIFYTNNSFGFFFETDKTDYSTVESLFKSNSTKPLFEYKYNRFCEGGKVYTPKYGKKNTSRGGHFGDKGDMPAHFFGQIFGSAIAYYLEGEGTQTQRKMDEVTEEFIPYLVKAAEQRYFTVNEWHKNGGVAPAHAQAMIITSLSVFLDFADTKSLWKQAQREVVVKWGNTLFDRSHFQHSHNSPRKPSDRWPDTVSKMASAYMLWGYVNKDIKVFKDGYRDLLQEYKKIPESGQYHQFYKGKYSGKIHESLDLFLETKALGDLVIASWIGSRVGLNTWTVANSKGGHIKAAIDYLGMLNSNPEILMGQDTRYLRNWRADSLSWVTILRMMDGDSNPLVAIHFETSKADRYKSSNTLSFSRCLANETR